MARVLRRQRGERSPSGALASEQGRAPEMPNREPDTAERIIAVERDVRDREAETYDAHIGRVPYIRAIEDEWIFNALDLKSTEVVLDAGCATGRHLERLLDEAGEVIGADHSQRS